MATKIEIKIEHDTFGFYGADENHDQPEMEENFEQAIDAEILKLYPQAEISHEWGNYLSEGVTVYVDDEPADINELAKEVTDDVMHIQVNIYSDGAFWSN